MIYASASGLVGQFAVCTAAIGIVDECFFAVVATGQAGEELSQCAEKRVFISVGRTTKPAMYAVT
jgi:hypothetical protein